MPSYLGSSTFIYLHLPVPSCEDPTPVQATGRWVFPFWFIWKVRYVDSLSFQISTSFTSNLPPHHSTFYPHSHTHINTHFNIYTTYWKPQCSLTHIFPKEFLSPTLSHMAPKSKTEQSPNRKFINRGAWTPEEDRKLAQCIELHGAKRWKTIALKSGFPHLTKTQVLSTSLLSLPLLLD